MNSDPYEILGIRPKASQHEIELAYKGRRSQYHPDRYQSADSETIAWATEQMQCLNRAYAVLSDPEKRAAFDYIVARAREAVAQRAESESVDDDDLNEDDGLHEDETSDPEDIKRPSLAALIYAGLAPYRGFERIYFSPNIPEKKLQAALGSYGAGTKPEEVLALMNTTVFGGAREGIFVTEQGIYAKDLMSDSWNAPWEEVDVLHIQGTTANLDGRKHIECTMVDKSELNRLFTILRAFVVDIQRYTNLIAGSSTKRRDASRRDSPWTDMALCSQMHRDAIAHLKDADVVLRKIESEAGEILLDRDSAVKFMNETAEAVLEPQKAKLAYRYLEYVSLLCRAICAVADGSITELPEAFYGHKRTEPPFVNELRATLRRLLGVN